MVLTNAFVPSKCLDGTTIANFSLLQNFSRLSMSSESTSGISCGNTMECEKSCSIRKLFARDTASFTLVSFSSLISIHLNFFPILNADSSLETITTLLIRLHLEIVYNISCNIISHRCLVFVCERFNLVFALENDLTGITIQVFKLNFNLV